MFNDLNLIAEIGMTHDGSFGLATRLTEEAINSGATVIKYQWHIADEETLMNAPAPSYFTEESRFQYFTRTEFTLQQFKSLSDLCRSKGVKSCVSVFSIKSLHNAVEAGFEIIKIPSGEITNIPLLREVRNTGLPVILSSGMSDWNELTNAVNVFPSYYPLCLLQCTSMYPTPSHKVGFNILEELKERFSYPIGLSDHTLGSATCIAALVFGATTFEKHFTISRSLYGPDARFSLDPGQFSLLAHDLQFVDEALKSPVNKDDISAFKGMKEIFQKSIIAAHDLCQGHVLTYDDFCYKKPGTGIPASKVDQLVGLRLPSSVNKNTMIPLDILPNE